jgi:hypothetical protein
MNRVLSTLVIVIWGLWLGSIAGMFIAVSSLSHTFEPSPGSPFVPAASNLFRLYELIQLGLAGASLLATFAWQLCKGATRFKVTLFALLALATVSSVVETAYVSPKILSLQNENRTQTDEFKKMHGMSFGLYTANAALLLVGGAMIPLGIAKETRERMAM